MREGGACLFTMEKFLPLQESKKEREGEKKKDLSLSPLRVRGRTRESEKGKRG